VEEVLAEVAEATAALIPSDPILTYPIIRLPSTSVLAGTHISRCLAWKVIIAPSITTLAKIPTMHWYTYVACFLAGCFLVNALPHFIKGITGEPFPTPFATPPGKGLSSPVVNVL
jgi:hypothetical protein